MVTLAGGVRGFDRFVRPLLWKSLQNIQRRVLDYQFQRNMLIKPFSGVKEVKQKVQLVMALQYQGSVSTEIDVSPDIRWNRTIQVIIIH